MDEKPGNIEEQLLVLQVQAGDAGALRALIDIYDRRLLYFIRRILGNGEDVFDVLQVVWLTVHRKLRQLRTPEAFRVWLFRIAHDQAVSQFRKRTRQEIVIDRLPEHSAAVPFLDEHAFENAEWVHKALERLSLDHRRVLTLRFLEDMTIEEIAAIVGCPVGTVKSRLHFAKAALRQRMEEMEHD